MWIMNNSFYTYQMSAIVSEVFSTYVLTLFTWDVLSAMCGLEIGTSHSECMELTNHFRIQMDTSVFWFAWLFLSTTTINLTLLKLFFVFLKIIFTQNLKCQKIKEWICYE